MRLGLLGVVLCAMASLAESATTGSLQLTVTIEPTLSVVATDPDASEPLYIQPLNMGTFTISRPNGAGALAVNFSMGGTAVRGVEYVLRVDRADFLGTSVTIPNGQDHVDIAVVARDDTTLDTTQSVILTLLPSGASSVNPLQASATVWIRENVPVVRIAASVGETAEGKPETPGVFRISRTIATGPLTVAFTRSGTAKFGTDYKLKLSVDGPDLTTTSVVIPDGEDHIDITVNPVDDTLAEGTETAILTLTKRTGYRLDPDKTKQKATVNILDNEPIVSIEAIDGQAAEGQPADPGTFRIRRTTTAGNLTVTFARSGTATFGLTGDYTLRVGGTNLTITSVVIPNGQDHVDITVAPVDDTLAEQTETAILTLAKGAGYTLDPDPAKQKATVSILDNEPNVGIEATDGRASSAPIHDGTFRISRTTTAGSLPVSFTRGGTAVLGVDYRLSVAGTPLTGTSVAIPDGQDHVDITVAVIAHAPPQPVKSVILTLAAKAAYSLNTAKTSATVWTLGDFPLVSITAIDDEAAETLAGEPANPGTFRVSRTTTSGNLAVAFTRSGTATFGPKADYTLSVGGTNLTTTTVVILNGQDHVDITVSPIDDKLPEPTQTVILTLAKTSAYSLDPDPALRTAAVRILDNDPIVSIAAIDNVAAETPLGAPADTGTFRISRTTTTGNLTVPFTRTGTATFGPKSDYTLSVGGTSLTTTSVVIPNGQDHVDITVEGVDDLIAEATETVVLTLGSSTAYALDPVAANRTATVYILDDEPWVSIEATHGQAAEGQPAVTGTLRIRRTTSLGDPCNTGNLTVTFTRTGTATFGPKADYTLRVGTANLTATSVVIPNSQDHVDITVLPIDDHLRETAETVILTLPASTKYHVAPSPARSATVSIQDND